MATPLQILFEDEHTLVINKPPGLSTQSPRGIESLEQRVREYLGGNCTTAADVDDVQLYLGLPHRLDRPVSGVIVMAKSKKAARKLSRQFERRRVRKVYWAVVEGVVEPAAGTLVDCLRKVPGEARVEIVGDDHPEGQRAVLHYWTLGQTPHGSWLEIEPETGRMHQIRVQLASRGWPVLGDLQYGGRTPFGSQFDDARRRAIALHARLLSLTLVGTPEPRSFMAPVSEAWRELGIFGAGE